MDGRLRRRDAEERKVLGASTTCASTRSATLVAILFIFIAIATDGFIEDVVHSSLDWRLGHRACLQESVRERVRRSTVVVLDLLEAPR